MLDELDVVISEILFKKRLIHQKTECVVKLKNHDDPYRWTLHVAEPSGMVMEDHCSNPRQLGNMTKILLKITSYLKAPKTKL